MSKRAQIAALPSRFGAVLDQIVDTARTRPARLLAWLLGFHVIVWTFVPMLVNQNLQLDLVEDLALGREWQLGYWKHPPLPWWLADLAYRITGHVHAVYVLGPLASALCFYAVWLLGRELVGEFKSLISVLALEGIHFYNFSVVKFAHDQMQLPFWALTGFFFWRAIVRGRTFDWMLAGIFLAGAFWSKYAVFVLAVTFGLLLVFDPFARRSLQTPGPYVMAVVFAIVVAPNVWWLFSNDFMPLQHVDSRAVVATRWYHYVLFPLVWCTGQLLHLAPALALLTLLYVPSRPPPVPAPNGNTVFNRRYIVVLALGPFAVATIIAAILGRLPIAFWGYPFWSFAPLAVLTLFPPTLQLEQLRRFVAAALAVLIVFPVVYVATEIVEPSIRERNKASLFPGRLLAETISQRWRERTGTPLAYVGGAVIMTDRGGGLMRETLGAGEFASNNIAVYSPDRPRVIVRGDLAISPWIDRDDLARRGAVLVWQATQDGLPESVRRAFPDAELQPPLWLPRQTLFSWVTRSPTVVYYALVLPRP